MIQFPNKAFLVAHYARRRRRRRGKIDTPFSQLMDATLGLRKLLKYLFLIWALALGIVGLFYLPYIPAQRNAELANEQPTVSVSDVGTPNGIVLASHWQDSLTTSNPDITTANIEAATAMPSGINSNSTSSQNLKVSAFKAVLFSTINGGNPIEKSLEKDADLTYLERKGEWIRVMVDSTGDIGFVHSTQIVNHLAQKPATARWTGLRY